MTLRVMWYKNLGFNLFYCKPPKYQTIGVKECDSGDITPCRQSRSHYQDLTERGALLDRYLLMQRVVY